MKLTLLDNVGPQVGDHLTVVVILLLLSVHELVQRTARVRRLLVDLIRRAKLVVAVQFKFCFGLVEGFA